MADALLVGAAGALIYRGVTNRPFNIKAAIGTERLTEEIQSLTERAKGWAQGWADEFKGKIERFRGQSGPIQVEKSIVIAKSPEELYAFWRNFENLPNIMSHLESVTGTRGKRSHWVAKGPAGVPIEWDAEIVEDKKNEMISWRALADADVPNEGTVYFEKAGDGQTELRVSMEYTLPGGEIGAALAEFFGEDPARKIEDDLNNFKEAVEGGEIMLGADKSYKSREDGN
ncbi:MAG: SRPBCC family protein [Candidatus Manganitrophus sp.]|nr:SRPBCC family protein [Candidatus Manganitrophus sp.]